MSSTLCPTFAIGANPMLELLIVLLKIATTGIVALSTYAVAN